MINRAYDRFCVNCCQYIIASDDRPSIPVHIFFKYHLIKAESALHD